MWFIVGKSGLKWVGRVRGDGGQVWGERKRFGSNDLDLK